MNTLRLVLVFTIGCVLQAQSTKTAKIEEIFRITKVEQMQKTMLTQILASMPAQMQQVGMPASADTAAFTKQLLNMIMDGMSWEKMKPTYITIYDETFSEDEISGLLLFYESPAGKAFITKSPELMGKMIAVSQEKMKQIGPEIQERAKKFAEKNQK